MSDIPSSVREIVDYGDGGVDSKDAEDLLHFVGQMIRQHDDEKLPVDAEWLDELWIKSGSQYSWDKFANQPPVVFEWNFRKSALSTTTLQVRFVGKTDDFEESWAVYANSVLLKSDPTRGEICSLLEILGGDRDD